MIERDEVRVDVADLTVPGLNAGEVEAVDENRKALAARQVGHRFVRFAWLAKDWGALGMAGAVDEADVVGTCGGSC